MESIISLTHLSFSYNDNVVLNDIELNIAKGEICFILGPNGSGKTTLLHCMNGLLVPASGTVTINTQNITSLPRRDRARLIAVVNQDSPDTFPYTVIDMVVMGRTPHLNIFDKPADIDYKIAWDILEYTGIKHLGQRSFTKLSGGEKQLVRLARALCQRSSILLLDEPSAHLDLKNIYTIFETIRTYVLKSEITLIAAIHDPNLVVRYAQNVILLKQGVILKQGPVASVMTADNLSQLYDFPITTHKVGEKIFITYENNINSD